MFAYPFFDLLNSRACHLSIHLINRTGGHFYFSPSCLFTSSSSSRRPSAQAQPPPPSLRLRPQLRPLHHPERTRESRHLPAVPSASVSLLSFHHRSVIRVSVFIGVRRCSSLRNSSLIQTLIFILYSDNHSPSFPSVHLV